MYIAIAILIIIIFIAIGVYVIKRNNAQQIEEDKSEVIMIASESLEEQFAKISQMNLSGDSLTEFETLDKSYRHNSNRSLPDISEKLNNLAAENNQFHFLVVRRELPVLEDKIVYAKQEQERIKVNLSKIQKDIDDHQKSIQQLGDTYKALDKKLQKKAFSLGPSVDNLKKQLATLEKQYQEYTRILESGDLTASEKALVDLKHQTNDLESKFERIPVIYKNINNVYPDQIKELTDGIKQMQDEGYKFETDLLSDLREIKKHIDENTIRLQDLEVDDAEKVDNETTDAINEIYDEVERQYRAKLDLDKKFSFYHDFVQHAEIQQRELQSEINRLSQNYELTHDEFAISEDLHKQLIQIRKDFDQLNQNRDKGLIYANEEEKLTQNIDTLKKIEAKQKEINDNISDLWKDEQEAIAAVQNFDVETRTMYRDLEQMNLPGVSEEYINYFEHVREEIKQLVNDLSQEQINLDDIERSLINTQSDIDALGQKTKEIIDSANLTEIFMQYTNRFRNTYPAIQEAYQQAYHLFQDRYDYNSAFDTISNAVEDIEPEAFKKLTEDYYASEQGKKQYPTK